jgi:glycosyltransferase involved in cell wall biosynthesis
LKVVHIITRLILGGAQENTLLTVKGLQAMGAFEVTLVSGPAIGPEGELVSEARAAGVRLILIDEMRREIHPWRDLRSYVKLTRLLRELRPDIVHTHSSKAGVLGRLAAWRAGVPVIIHTIHGQAFHDYQPWWVRKTYLAAERFCARFSHRIISVCDAMTDQAVNAGVARREKFVTIYSGMEADRFLNDDYDREALRARLGFGPGDLVVGKVARLAPLKGHQDVVEAAARVLPEFPAMKLLFVGGGKLRGGLERLAETLGMKDHVKFAGLVDRTEVADYIKAMDVLVHASLREGLARVLPQALMAGVPTISYDIDGAREVVIRGRTGWLVEPGSVEGLSAALSAALGDLPAARRLALQGRELCKERFPARIMVERIAQLYRQLVRQMGRE